MAVKKASKPAEANGHPDALAVPPDDRLDRLIEVVQTMWTDPYARPHCRKSGGLPRAGCDCPICAADAKLKALLAQPVTVTG